MCAEGRENIGQIDGETADSDIVAGLKLPEAIMEELVAVAPWALAMARRLKRTHGREIEVSSVFDPIRDVD